MYKVEIEELGEYKVSLCETINTLGYIDLYNLVKPYLNFEHLSFSVPNYCFNGYLWGYIYAGKEPVGKIKITAIY